MKNLPPTTGSSQGARSSTKDVILDVTERLYGEHGPHGVSLRQIALASGSSNNSVIQYHFNDVAGLITAVFERRFSSLEIRRGELLGEILQSGQQFDTRSLFRALVLPIAEEKDGRGKSTYAAFLLGLRIYDDITKWRGFGNSPPVTSKIDVLLRESLEFLPARTYQARLLYSVTTFLVAVVDWDKDGARIASSYANEREVFLEEMIDMAVGGMSVAV